MPKRNYTVELRKAQKNGAKIVASMQPHEGVEMEYAPRKKGDPSPWVFANRPHSESSSWYRYTGRECHAVLPEGATPAPTARPLGEIQQYALTALREQGTWYGTGWVWGNFSTTVRIMESLAKRGLVTRAPYTSRWTNIQHRYTITEAGIKAVPTALERVEATLAERQAASE